MSPRRAPAELPAMALQAEEAVLGAILLEGQSLLTRVAARVEAEDFITDAHRAVYRAMLALLHAGHPVDAILTESALRKAGDIDLAGGAVGLALLIERGALAIAANVPCYIDDLLEERAKRELKAISLRLGEHASNGARPQNILGELEREVARIRARFVRRPDEPPSELNALLEHRFAVRADVIARGILPKEGFGVVGGKAKTGKSLLLDNLCLQRGRGKPWLGFPTDPGVTLVLSPEVSAPAAAERYRTMLRYDPEPVPAGRLHLKTRRGVLIDTPEGLAQVMTWMEETGADVVRFDPLARVMCGDENSNRDMSTVVRAVDTLIERYKCSVIIAHHPTKPTKDQARTGGDRLRGAGALFGAADSVIMMDRTDDRYTLTFELRGGRELAPMRITRTEDLWFVPAGADPELVALATLTQAAPLPYRALVGAAHEDLKLSEGTAKRRIPAAVAAGLLAKDLDGLYRPGPAYQQAVSQSHGVSSYA